MINFNDNVIPNTFSIRQALEKINTLSVNLTLFVVDVNNRMVGTLTDGDIRRGLLKDFQLNDSIENVMRKNFHFFKENNYTIKDVKSIKGKHIQLVPVLNKKYEIIKIYDFSRIKSLLPIDAILMAGGRGERLRPITDKTPKPLLKVGGKSIIDYNIDNLISYGVENIYITVHYLSGKIIKHVQHYSEDIKIKCVNENSPLGTFGSVKKIETLNSDYVLIMNADIFTNIDYEDFFMTIIRSNADMTIATVPYTVNVPYAIMDTEGDVVKGFKEKPVITHYANAGIYIIKRELIEMIPDTYYNATDFIQLLIETGKKIVKYPIIGYWVDIGKPEDYKMVQELVKHIKN
jgi:dTDP-glucose pyrophosphorylase